MDKQKVIKYVKISVVCLILVLFIWFFLLNPFVAFKKNEKTMLNAAKRYFEINSNELPTGNRVKTLSLKTLYYKSFIKEDLKLPNSSKTCSVSDSWVKVKKVDNEYKYYVYLKCGALSSNVDSKGPEITLNGDDVITINRGDKYEELGVKSVVDNTDGKLKVSNVTIDNSKVKTNKVGTYKVTYTISDSFNNETVKTRTVKVVASLNNIVKKDTSTSKVYKGVTVNNYIEFSGMLFRIVGFDSNNNIKIVSDKDISFVDYKSLDKWLDYYYDHLTDESKEYIVKSKYCNGKVSDDKLDTTKCSSYTSKKNLYILSIDDYNNSLDSNGSSYLYPSIVSLLANKKNDKEVYTTRQYFMGTDYKYMSFDINYSFGVRPVITINKDILLKSGDGTLNSPYSFESYDKAKAGDKLSSRYSGEYITYSGYTWRIMDALDDGTVKVILNDSLRDNNSIITTSYNTSDKAKIYNPNQKGNVGYFINNKMTEYINTDYFVSKNISVPIYSNRASYKGETSTKKYKVKLSAPNMYDMFTASNYNSSYWLINSSKTQYIKYVVSDNGTVYYTDLGDDFSAGIKLIGYLNKNCSIKSGDGTLINPYVIVK